MSGFINYGPNKVVEAPKEQRVFIQWKGTDACFDFYCECGEHCHFDGYFAYVVECPKCNQKWEMPSLLTPRKVCDDTYSHDAKMMEGDDE